MRKQNPNVLTVAIFVALLASCAPIEPREFQGPNGKTAYYMRCSGAGRTMDACYKRAGELCPSGYSIVERKVNRGVRSCFLHRSAS
jgi:hypothetical protein